MNLKKRIVSFLICIVLLCTSCSKINLSSNVDAAFENFTREVFRQDVSSTTLGLHYTLENPSSFDIENPTITFGSFQTNTISALASLENYEAVLKQFPYNALSSENRLTHDVFSAYIQSAKEGLSYGMYAEPLSPLTGIHAQLPVLLAEYKFRSLEDVDTYLALLQTTTDYFESLIEFETEKAESGLFMSDHHVDEVLEQCNAFLSMGENHYLFSTFEERLRTISQISETQISDYCIKNKNIVTQHVFPAYENLMKALEKLKGSGKNEKGLCYLPKGKNYYAYLIASETGSSRSIEEIQSLIQAQIQEDFLAMQSVFKEQTVSNISCTPEEAIDILKTKMKTTFPVSQEIELDIKYVPTALEEYLSPAFYFIPAIDNPMQNTIYLNKAHTLEDIQLFTTLAHEGYPGHLYQTTYYASKNNDPLRSLFHFKGYIEGWATYAEMCSYYLSPLEKPYATLLQKNNSLILGLYALADLGIHYQGWDLERTVQFFETYGISQKEIIEEIYQLIIGDPGNYVSYYVGYLEILELKKDVMKQKGNAFSQKEFHKTFLDIGPAPFDVVRKIFKL